MFPASWGTLVMFAVPRRFILSLFLPHLLYFFRHHLAVFVASFQAPSHCLLTVDTQYQSLLSFPHAFREVFHNCFEDAHHFCVHVLHFPRNPNPSFHTTPSPVGPILDARADDLPSFSDPSAYIITSFSFFFINFCLFFSSWLYSLMSISHSFLISFSHFSSSPALLLFFCSSTSPLSAFQLL